MTSCVFRTAILFALNLVTFPCEGKITSPPDGARMTFLPGSTEKIQWLFDDAIIQVLYRSWHFTSSDGSRTEELARIEFGDGEPQIFKSSLPGVAIEKPATLVLRNIDLKNNGVYTFELRSIPFGILTFKSKVVVFVAVKPWKTAITFTPEKVVVAGSANITCESNGFPEPSYTIFHNDTEVSTKRMHTISKLNWSDAGPYRCVAVNILGSNSKSYCLTVVGETAASKKVDHESSAETVVVWHIVVSLVSGIIIGILFSYIVWCSRRRWQFRNRKPERNPEAQPTEADAAYQELNLTKMNTEENYESLRVNATSNDEESTYTELNTARDEENNYQSLT